jgi:CRP/FNR family cyclic AMP-dependent transcriptional regulator
VETGTRIPVRLAQNELAALVGASRVRVNQIMVDYKRRGYVTVDNDLRITLLDPQALRHLCDDELLSPDRMLD